MQLATKESALEKAKQGLHKDPKRGLTTSEKAASVLVQHLTFGQMAQPYPVILFMGPILEFVWSINVALVRAMGCTLAYITPKTWNAGLGNVENCETWDPPWNCYC